MRLQFKQPNTNLKEGRYACKKNVALAAGFAFCLLASAQDCPPNLDFETGTFNGWNCYTGSVADIGGANKMYLSQSLPLRGRHTVFTRSADTQLDPYGGFPVVCPNGSGYSIRLGNNTAGTEAEGVSYEFTIPQNRDIYSLIYHYAVVFQDPAHQPYQQPRLEIEITNVTDNTVLTCSSFSFFPVGSPLPGFFMSTNSDSNTPVWCKNWSAVSINLDGLAGKTIRLFFKTADCTYRRHFGYAYVDVNTECSGEFTGATFCNGDSAVNVIAPFGYEKYSWYNADFREVLGTSQELTLRPAPTAGTLLAVKVEPYFGYGCTDTLYARLIDTLTVKAFAGPDKSICFDRPEQIGTKPKPGLFYEWAPREGLSQSTVSNPFANPAVPTMYTLTSRSYGGGCLSTDSVLVRPVLFDTGITLHGKNAFCFGYGDSAVLSVAPGNGVQWFRDEAAIADANTPVYRIDRSGTYYAQLEKDGCKAATTSQSILIEAARPGLTYPPLYLVANTPATLQARTFGQSVLWRPSLQINSPTVLNPEFKGTTDQVYTIQITSGAGCITIDTQAVKVVAHVDIKVPTAFTPNRDGRNDLLRPSLFGIRELLYFRVYNRWGEQIFETRKQDVGWDGRFNGKMQGTQTVIWIAEGIGMDGKKYNRKGTTICIQ